MQKPSEQSFAGVSLPLFAWAAAMLAVSSVPGQSIPEVGLWQWDKLAHLAEFAVFASLLYRYLRVRWAVRGNRLWLLCLAVGTACGVFDELHQLLVPERFCTWQDLAADLAGLGLGTGLMQLTMRSGKPA
jgi:VanZ family protein